MIFLSSCPLWHNNSKLGMEADILLGCCYLSEFLDYNNMSSVNLLVFAALHWDEASSLQGQQGRSVGKFTLAAWTSATWAGEFWIPTSVIFLFFFLLLKCIAKERGIKVLPPGEVSGVDLGVVLAGR